MKLARILAPLAALLAAACAEHAPLAPSAPATPAPAGREGVRLECTANVAALTVRCAVPGTPGSVRGAIIGGQNQFVHLASSNVSFDVETRIFQADVTVQNLLPYPIGTSDGTTADTGAVKVFFHSGPTATEGSGVVTVDNADGTGVFTAANQPFFRYAAPLASNQTSAPKTWRFLLDAGVTAFSFTLFIEAQTPPWAFRIVAPEAGDTIPYDSLAVDVVAGAPPGVNFVRATLGATTVLLNYAGGNHWSRKINVRQLTNGTVPLKVVAVTPVDSAVQTVNLVFTLAPVMTVTLPVDGSVARPGLRVMGTCVSQTTCSVRGFVEDFEISLFNRAGPVFDFVQSMASYEGEERVLYMTAYDAKLNHDPTGAARRFFVESSTHITEVVSLGTEIVAASPTAVLYKDSTDAAVPLRYRDLSTGADSVVLAGAAGRQVNAAFITPRGALFTIPTPSATDSLYEFRDGAVIRHGVVSRLTLDVEGRWAAWVSGAGTLVRRDVEGDSTTLIPVAGTAPNVGSNGDVVYVFGGQVWRYRAGVPTPLSTAGGTAPRTDGTFTVYGRGSQIVLHDGSGETVLSSVNAGYDVNGGWVAYTTYATNATVQVFTRAPDGTFRQASTGSVPASVVAVGAGGEVVFLRDGKRFYTALPYASAVDVGHDWGLYRPLRFYGSTPRLFIGRTVFSVVP